jgi:outer membrane protein assembly factor BamB
MNLFVFGLSDAQDANWPQFRGPNCSGLAQEGQSPPFEFGPTQNVLWKTAVPAGHSSPCIWGDQIFLSGFDEDKQEISVFCINRSDGSLEWRQIVPTDTITKVNSWNSPASPTMATDGQRVYAYFSSFGLVCYDLAGNQQWTLPLPIPKARHGLATSPIVTGEVVILNNDDLNGAYIMAVDRRSGQVAWKKPQPRLSKMPQECYATPVVWRNQIILYRRGEIFALNPENGEREWWFTSLTQGISTPVVANDMLYVATYQTLGEPELHIELPDFNLMVSGNDQNGDKLISKEEFPEDLTIIFRPETKEGDGRTQLKKWFRIYDTNKDTFLDSTEWANSVDVFTEMMTVGGLVAIKPGGKGDITATNLVWREIKAVPEVPSPLYYDGLIYMIKNGGIASCMNAITGELQYRQRLGASGTYFSSPIAANGKIYIASRKGIISVFEAGEQLNILAKNEIEEDIFATPAVLDNTLYVRTTKHLYAFCEL